MRDNLRMSILENIPMGMLLVPYVNLKLAGDYHYVALLFGIAISGVYAWIIYGYAKLFRANSNSIATSGYGLIDTCLDIRSYGGWLLSVCYVIRFLLKAAFVIYVVSYIVTAGEPKLWYVVLVFSAICIYGALGDFGKRRSLANMLMWWMLVPLILLTVFSISRMNYTDIADIFTTMAYDTDNVFQGAWIILAVMSTFELMIFSIGRCRRWGAVEFSGIDFVRIIVWVFIAVIVAYLYMVGMVGRAYIARADTFQISFGVGIDYALAGAWIIGAFYVASSYIFYAKEFMLELSDGSLDRNNRINLRYIMLLALLFTGIILFVCCIDYDRISPYLIKYLIYADAAISLAVPAIILLTDKLAISRKRR